MICDRVDRFNTVHFIWFTRLFIGSFRCYVVTDFSRFGLQ